MSRQLAKSDKKRGRPATGQGEPILVRLQPVQLGGLDRWIAHQDDQLTRPEAIRRLVDLALAGTQPPKARSPKARSGALDLAGAQIDKLSDPSACDEEWATSMRPHKFKVGELVAFNPAVSRFVPGGVYEVRYVRPTAARRKSIRPPTADRCSLNRVTEVAREFTVRR